MQLVAPALIDEFFIWRPALAEPPLCTVLELKSSLTIDDLAVMHEMLNLKDAATAKAQQEAERAKGRR